MFTPSADPWLLRAERLVDAVVTVPRRLSGAGDEGRIAALLAMGLALSAWWPASIPVVPTRVVHLPGTGWVDGSEVEGLDPGVPDGERLVLLPEPGVRCADATAVPSAPLPGTDGSGSPAAAFGRPVSINRASVAELESLPGIGPALAARIVAGRPYRAVGDLDHVKGIGPATIARLRGRVEP